MSGVKGTANPANAIRKHGVTKAQEAIVAELVKRVMVRLEDLDRVVASMDARDRVLFFAAIIPRYSERYCHLCGKALNPVTETDHSCPRKAIPPDAIRALVDELEG